jgi:two-component system response regulator AtoC
MQEPLVFGNPGDAAPGGRGSLMQNILETIAKVAVSDLSVRIVGECGSGKEWLARALHRLSARADREFVHLDCSSIPDGLVEEEIFGAEAAAGSDAGVRRGVLERANGGTIYFDKISALPSKARERVIAAFEQQHFRRLGGHEEVCVNVRAIEGLNKPVDENDLRRHARVPQLRRLGQVCINIPPLRERRGDIPHLVAQFIGETGSRLPAGPQGMTREALASCLSYDWPGNIRELRDAVAYAVSVCPEQTIGRPHLPAFLRDASAGGAGPKDRFDTLLNVTS